MKTWRTTCSRSRLRTEKPPRSRGLSNSRAYWFRLPVVTAVVDVGAPRVSFAMDSPCSCVSTFGADVGSTMLIFGAFLGAAAGTRATKSRGAVGPRCTRGGTAKAEAATTINVLNWITPRTRITISSIQVSIGPAAECPDTKQEYRLSYCLARGNPGDRSCNAKGRPKGRPFS